MELRFTNKRVASTEQPSKEYVAYELWDNDIFLCGFYGGCAVAALGEFADNFGSFSKSQKKGCDLLLKAMERGDKTRH